MQQVGNENWIGPIQNWIKNMTANLCACAKTLHHIETLSNDPIILYVAETVNYTVTCGSGATNSTFK